MMDEDESEMKYLGDSGRGIGLQVGGARLLMGQKRATQVWNLIEWW